MIPEINDIITKVLMKERDHAREVVEAIIDSEQNYLFTNDTNYRDNRQEIIQQEPQQMPGGPGPYGQGGPG